MCIYAVFRIILLDSMEGSGKNQIVTNQEGLLRPVSKQGWGVPWIL